jgi:hypothetical protein
LVGQGEKAERSSTDVHPADGKQTKSDKLKDFGLTTSNPALASHLGQQSGPSPPYDG